MSSSFPTARFPALPLGKEKEGADPLYKDATGTSEGLSDETLIAQICENDDEALIARICNDDNEALTILFRRYARMVWSIAKRIVRNEAEADDLVQEVFLLIQRRASVFDRSKGTARSLIVHMTYQRALSRRRYLSAKHGQASKEAEEQAAKIAAPAALRYDESFEAHFSREQLRKALGEMSEDQRATLRLYFIEGYTFREIAGKLGQTAGNVSHHYYRALERLRRHLPR